MIRPVEHVRPMRGGAQSHLIRGDDGHYYVVKFLNNPQHSRILANEWLGTNLARFVGLSAPHAVVMDVDQAFIATHKLSLRIAGKSVACSPGPAFASRLPVQHVESPIYDHLPEARLALVENLDEFAGILAVDKWLCNCDGRQVVFCRPQRFSRLRAYFVDFGFCFNAGEWSFPDSPLRGAHSHNAVYRTVTGWDSFEPWLSRIETLRYREIKAIAYDMPPPWRTDTDALNRLVADLLLRRGTVRRLIESVRFSNRAPFTNWTDANAAAATTLPPEQKHA